MRRRQAFVNAVLCLGLVCAACGDRPERLGNEPNPAPKPAPAPVSTEPRFSGRLVVEGLAESPPGAAVFLSARRIGQRLPALSRKYELRDAAWTKEGESRVLQFELTDLDNMGGFGAPMAAEMEIEARYDPDGMIDPRPGSEEPGVVRTAVPASPGSKGVEIALRLDAPK